MSPPSRGPAVRFIAETAESGLQSAFPAFAGAYGGLVAGALAIGGAQSALHDMAGTIAFWVAAVLVPACSVIVRRRAARVRERVRASGVTQGIVIDVATLLIVYGVVRSIWTIVLRSRGGVSPLDLLASPFGVAVLPSIAVIVFVFARVRGEFRPITRSALGLLGVFLWGGVLLAAMLNPDPRWWEQSISFLGSRSNLASDVFNAAILLSALMLFTVAALVAADLGRLAERKTAFGPRGRAVALSLLVAAVGLLNVAVFPNKPFGRGTVESWIHNISAYVFFALIVLLMLSMRWLVPAIGRRFSNLDWALTGFAFVTLALYIAGYVPLAIFEVLCMGAMSVWFVLFVRTLGLVARESARMPVRAGDAA